MSANFTPNKEDIKILPPFKMQVLTNFPYIEADFDALTNYQLLCKIVEYLNAVIHNENEVTEEVTGLYNAYVSLQDYVNNYFDNLDVQDEVNNKLDEMAESGELTDIIAQYLGLAGMITYNTVAELKAAENIVNGSKCETLGYHEVNDGGGAIYKIRNITNEDVVDEGSIIALHNELLVAELIVNADINIKQFGAYGDGLHDDSDYIQNAIDYGFSKGIDVKVPATIAYYKITRPLVIETAPAGIGDQYWNGNGTRLYGDYKARCKIIKIGNTTSGIEEYDVNSTIICKNNTATGIFLDNLSLGNYETTDLNTKNSTSYSVYTKCSRSTYSNLNLNSYHGLYGECFSSLFENIVFNCTDDALHITNGTSNTFRFMYAFTCNNPYFIQSSYTTVMNCASDGCTGSIYKCSGLGLTFLNCGSESRNAQYIFEQLNSTWFDVTVQGMMIDRQVGNPTASISVGDCAIALFQTTGVFKLRDCTIVERERIASGNSYVFKLTEAGKRISTTIENLAYYKNYTGDNNSRMLIWNNYTEGYTAHRYSSGGMTFNYQVIGEGKLIPFIGSWKPARGGEISTDALVDEGNINKAIYLDSTGRYGTSQGSIQYQSRPNLGDIHLFNDPKAYNAYGDVVTAITSDALWSVSKLPIVITCDTASRPTTNLYAGLCIFDTTLNKPLWYDGSHWKDATGTNV